MTCQQCLANNAQNFSAENKKIEYAYKFYSQRNNNNNNHQRKEQEEEYLIPSIVYTTNNIVCSTIIENTRQRKKTRKKIPDSPHRMHHQNNCLFPNTRKYLTEPPTRKKRNQITDMVAC